MSTLAEVIRKAMEYRLSDVRVALPGRFEAYDASTQKADVKPLLEQVVDAEGGAITESLPVLPSVPVAFPHGGGFFLSLPIQKGDTGMIIVCDRSHDQWVKKGGDVDPVDRRLHGLGGAVFYPGFRDDAGKLRDAHGSEMVLGKDGGTRIHIKDGMVALGEETPMQKALLGTAFRASHTTLINALRTTVTGQATGWAALTTVFTALASDPAHNAVKAALLGAATACTAAAGMATSGAAACSAFESAAAANQDFQSNTVRLKR